MHVDPLVFVLAEMPRTFTRILATHIDDGHGRCSGCATDPRLRERWPCGPRAYAVEAQRLYGLTHGAA